MRRSILVLMLSSLAPPCAGQTTAAATVAGEAQPVKRLASAPRRAADIDFVRVEFQQPYFGREGPGLWHLEGEPSRGARYVVEARVYGEESIATAAFEAIDERGAVIQSIRMVRQPSASGTSDLVGVMLVPDQPFRIVMSGEGLDGVRYQRTYERLFRPTQHPPSGPRLPPNTPPEMVQQMTQMVDEATQRALATLEDEQSKHPDGLIVMPRTEVSNLTYAPLSSAAGRPIGLRVAYDVKFSEDGYYNPELHVFPTYESEAFRGVVDMHVIDGSIEPQPEEAGSPQQRPNILAYGAGFRYKGGITYRFTADLIPDFIIQNEAKTKYCIYSQKFRYDSARKRAVWSALLSSRSSAKYMVRIDNTDVAGAIDAFHAPGAFHASFAAEGAQDCGSQPTRHF